MRYVRNHLVIVLGIALGASAPLAAQAQAASAAPLPPREFETRAQLQQQIKIAEDQHRTSEAWLLRTRLERGDFQEGDRIVVMLENNPRPDTMQVRAGKVLQFTGMADLSLDGVLRSELTDTLRQHLARYLRNPGVRATPLLPITVVGSVTAPGFYYTAADVALRDVIMRAGGPRDADLNRVTVRRAGEVIWNSQDVRVALADGMSLDRLHLRAGDEIVVPQQKRFQMATIVSVASLISALSVILATR